MLVPLPLLQSSACSKACWVMMSRDMQARSLSSPLLDVRTGVPEAASAGREFPEQGIASLWKRGGQLRCIGWSNVIQAVMKSLMSKRAKHLWRGLNAGGGTGGGRALRVAINPVMVGPPLAVHLLAPCRFFAGPVFGIPRAPRRAADSRARLFTRLSGTHKAVPHAVLQALHCCLCCRNGRRRIHQAWQWLLARGP
jgi:hypothetical protein